MLDEKFRGRVQKTGYKAGSILGRAGLSPNMISLLVLVTGLAAAYMIYTGSFAPAIILILVSGILDFLDGAVAKATGRTTKFGGILDSTIDKTTEIAVYLAIALFSPVLFLPASLAISTFMLSSYVSKHAAASGAVKKKVHGALERKERIALIIIALAFFSYADYILYIIAVLSASTAVQRLLIAGKSLKWK
ncbi:MAG: CDP-alcohol phosphatidyltransferase family protein [Candidatus Aenigmarchaeota archaeon]|nr:CDP-alcohol phosphatidyltransferase family protein [Candidatus Aenigmarchaeota archaeon]